MAILDGARMKSFVLMFAGGVLLTISGCGSGSMGTSSTSAPTSTPTPTPTPISSTHNEWTWAGGSNTINPPGTYGVQGTAAAGNTPGGRYGAVSWTDASGNFWLFGGTAAPSSTSDNYFNDLWKYSAGQWTWMGGSNTYNQAGIYGTKGVAAPGNIPGGRVSAVSWKDTSGNFWLLGGVGLDINGLSNALNDLWKYSAGQWTWMGGSDTGTQTQPGIYGTQGMAAPGNIPGARWSAVSWTDGQGAFWLFGGYGLDSKGTMGYLNDLWKYNGGEWTWMGGSSVVNQPGTYGTKGTAAPGNSPGARIEANAWTDAAGNLGLFGGSPGPPTQFELFNDLWKYSGGEWTWMSGSSSVNQSGTYGTQGVAAPSTNPGARVLALTWTDAAGNFWLFGGDGYDSTAGINDLNDLWKYSAGQWTWVGGSNLGGELGTYGTQGTAASGNIPGARFQPIGWTDTSGNLWLFGGDGYETTTTQGYFNDLWKYEP